MDGVFVSFGVQTHCRVLEAKTLVRNVTIYQLTQLHRTEDVNHQQVRCNIRNFKRRAQMAQL